MFKKGEENNLAFVDGQNLHLGTTKSEKSWIVDLAKFRIYLEKKYDVKKAYYFLGFTNSDYQNLYNVIQEAGFILIFKPHNLNMSGEKKGNVDSDIIFSVMEKMYRREKFDKIILVSGDGDYKKLVDFLIAENRFKKILFPNKKFASSLYKKITRVYYDYLENLKGKICKNKQKERGTLGN
ncbi:MAG: NYN domain-containing protein [Patescibacteria group bacterium]